MFFFPFFSGLSSLSWFFLILSHSVTDHLVTILLIIWTPPGRFGMGQ
jgi:hypothetical protein